MLLAIVVMEYISADGSAGISKDSSSFSHGYIISLVEVLMVVIVSSLTTTPI